MLPFGINVIIRTPLWQSVVFSNYSTPPMTGGVAEAKEAPNLDRIQRDLIILVICESVNNLVATSHEHKEKMSARALGDEGVNLQASLKKSFQN